MQEHPDSIKILGDKLGAGQHKKNARNATTLDRNTSTTERCR